MEERISTLLEKMIWGQLVNYEPSMKRNVVPVGQSQLWDTWSLLLYRIPTLYLQSLCVTLCIHFLSFYYLSITVLLSFSFWCWGPKSVLVYALPLSYIPAELLSVRNTSRLLFSSACKLWLVVVGFLISLPVKDFSPLALTQVSRSSQEFLAR